MELEMLELLINFTNAVPNDGTRNYQACMSKAYDLIKKATGNQISSPDGNYTYVLDNGKIFRYDN